MRRIGGAFLAALFLPGIPGDARAGEGRRPPSIIYIMADDLGYGDLGCYGQKVVQTPHLDRMAREGMRFLHHYSGHTVCRPSRLSLWTGMHTGHTAISSNASYAFKHEDVTVAELLKQAGFATGGVGKWAMGGVETTGHPNRNGLDSWFGYLDQGDAHNFYPEHLFRNMEKVPLPGNQEGPRKRVSVKRVTYSHDVMTEEAFKFIREHAGRPFLLHVHWTIPHANNEGGGATGDGMEVPEYGIYADRDWPNPEKGFAAMVGRMDRDVGRLFDLLKELKIDGDTVVFFTSDNGPHNEGNHKHTFFDSNGPLRGYKRDLYDGGIRVPFLARWPGKIREGSVSDHVSAFWDWLPTACELAGVPPPDAIDGISYLPTLLGRPQKEHEYLYWQSQGKEAVRMGPWKGVRPGKGKPVELYDILKDPEEGQDLAAGQPDVVKRIEGIMKEAVRAP